MILEMIEKSRYNLNQLNKDKKYSQGFKCDQKNFKNFLKKFFIFHFFLYIQTLRINEIYQYNIHFIVNINKYSMTAFNRYLVIFLLQKLKK